MLKYSIILFGLLFFSCAKQREWYVNTHVYNATLEANTSLITGTDTIPLRYVIIQLFESEYDRYQNQNSVATNQTDENGYAPIFHLTGNYYYVKAHHYIYGEKYVQVATPDGEVSKVEIIFSE